MREKSLIDLRIVLFAVTLGYFVALFAFTFPVVNVLFCFALTLNVAWKYTQRLPSYKYFTWLEIGQWGSISVWMVCDLDFEWRVIFLGLYSYLSDEYFSICSEAGSYDNILCSCFDSSKEFLRSLRIIFRWEYWLIWSVKKAAELFLDIH